MTRLYNNLIPKELINITKKVNPVYKTDGERSFMDDICTHEYYFEEDDKEVLIYNSRGKLVSIKYKNKLKENI
jgi:hypothetical protein